MATKQTFQVTVYYQACRTFEVTAADQQEAAEKAAKRAERAGIEPEGSMRVVPLRDLSL